MKAHQILTIARNASRAMAISTHIGASLSINAGQYLYTFKDGSALLINGQAMRAFSTADDAINQ